MNCFPQHVKNEYGKKWECYNDFSTQYIEDQDFIEVQICHREPETGDADRWDILPLLETEAKVKTNGCLLVTIVCIHTSPSESTSYMYDTRSLVLIY